MSLEVISAIGSLIAILTALGALFALPHRLKDLREYVDAVKAMLEAEMRDRKHDHDVLIELRTTINHINQTNDRQMQEILAVKAHMEKLMDGHWDRRRSGPQQ